LSISLQSFKRTVRLWPLVVVFLTACSPTPETLEILGSTMGTTYSVKVVEPRHGREALAEIIERRLDSVNDQMSTWRPDSEISRFNADPGTAAVEISADFFNVVQQALRLGTLTRGALDITVMPLVSLWGFGPDFSADALPDETDITAILAHVGLDKLELDSASSSIRKLDPETRIDLSAIAKGFGVDAIAGVLSELGYRDYLVEIGGEVFGAGRRPDGTPWRIAVERPLADERSVQTVVPLDNAGIATSGDYRNFFEIAGRRYSHVIDPATGRPPENGVASVSVIARDTTTADGLATGLMVMGAEAGLALAEKKNLAVLFVLHTPAGLETRASSAFDALAGTAAPRP